MAVTYLTLVWINQMSLVMLSNENVMAQIAPHLGSEIRMFKTLAGKNIFLQTPWTESALEVCECNANNEEHFLNHYHGGMQMMFPNAGYGSSFAGFDYGYHGEVWHKNWTLKSQTPSQLTLETYLSQQQVRIDRAITIENYSLRIEDKIDNLGTEVLNFQCGYHPAFSSDFIDNGSSVEIRAKNIEIIRSTHPTRPFQAFKDLDTIIFKQVFAQPYSFLAFISNFLSPTIEVKDEQKNLVATINIDTKNMPYAWVWIENRFTSDQPWKSNVQTFAFEPCSSKTNLGLADAVSKGLGHLELLPKQSLTTFLEIQLTERGIS